MLIPKDIEQLGVVIEFKTVRDEKADLREAAKEALQQIEQRAYAVELKQRGFQRILKMGLAFRNKEVVHDFSWSCSKINDLRLSLANCKQTPVR